MFRVPPAAAGSLPTTSSRTSVAAAAAAAAPSREPDDSVSDVRIPGEIGAPAEEAEEEAEAEAEAEEEEEEEEAEIKLEIRALVAAAEDRDGVATTLGRFSPPGAAQEPPIPAVVHAYHKLNVSYNNKLACLIPARKNHYKTCSGKVINISAEGG